MERVSLVRTEGDLCRWRTLRGSCERAGTWLVGNCMEIGCSRKERLRFCQIWSDKKVEYIQQFSKYLNLTGYSPYLLLKLP